jgi:hypothetical protein
MNANHIKWLPVLLASTLFIGCATGPTYQESTAQMRPLAAENGRIFIYRKTSLGAAVQPEVTVDGEPVGKAKPKGYFYVDLPPGSHEISASTEAERNLKLTLDAGEEKYVRLEVKMGAFVGHVKPVLVDTAVGREEIQKMKYVGSGE